MALNELEKEKRLENNFKIGNYLTKSNLNFETILSGLLYGLEEYLSKEKIDTSGIIAVIKNMENLLAENNIKPIDAIGEIFDPQLHEAVSMVVDDTLDEGTITQEVSKGYISGKAILKPSKVIVSKK